MVKIGGFNDRYFHAPYHPGWTVFENEIPPDGRNVTWEAFVEYVASNTGDAVMNEHWQTQRKYSKIFRLKLTKLQWAHKKSSKESARWLSSG